MQKVNYKHKNAGYIQLKSIHPLDKYIVYGYLRKNQTLYFEPTHIQYFNLLIMANIIVLYSYGNTKKIKYSIHREVFILYDYYKPCKYKPLSTLNNTYIKCLDVINKRTGIKYVIKKHKDVFLDLTDGIHILSEIRLLMHFKHPNILSIIDTIPCETTHIDSYTNIYLIMPKMQTTLSKAIRHSKIKLRDNHCQFIMYQLLRAVTYLHSANITHANLQPKNILINCRDCHIKITGFNVSNVIQKENIIDNSNICYVSPESLIHSNIHHHKNGDVWSLGCIFAELLIGKQLFSSKNRFDQLREIFELVGTPTDLLWIESKAAKKWILRSKQYTCHGFRNVFEKVSIDALDLLNGMLVTNPLIRYSSVNCLRHTYVKIFYCKNDEKICDMFDVLDDKLIQSKFVLRDKMYQVLTSYW
eukprot:493597_1